MKTNGRDLVFPIVNCTLLALLALICLYPMLYIVFASLSMPDQLMRHTGLLWHSLGFTLEGYKLALNNPNILSGYINTAFYVIVGTIANIAVTAGGAFMLSRKDAMLAKPIMLGVVFTMYFSGGLIPMYLLVNQMGLNNTRTIIIIISLVSSWNLIVMRTSFLGIPDTLEESAKIDGAGPLTTLVRIYLPLSLPMLATMALFYGVGRWNSWFDAMVYLRDRSKYPLQLFMREILVSNDMTSMTNIVSIGTYSSDMYNLLVKYCIIMLATAPILVIYPFFQRFFIKGVMIGAIKG